MTVGQRIKARREECGLSVIKLATMLGKARSTVYRYESDEIQDMPITVLEPLAEALRTTPEYLMGWSDNPNDNGGSLFHSNSDYQTGPFSDRIVRVMSDREIDISALAQFLNISDGAIEEIIYDTNPPSDKLLGKISLCLAVDVPWLRGDTLEPIYYLENDEFRIITNYRRASQDTRRAVSAILSD